MLKHFYIFTNCMWKISSKLIITSILKNYREIIPRILNDFLRAREQSEMIESLKLRSKVEMIKTEH